MKPKVNVIPITEKTKPKFKNPVFQQGIRDRAAAEAWGEKNDFDTVYFLPGKQRVYAERTSMRVDLRGKKLAEQSTEVLRKVVEAVEAL